VKRPSLRRAAGLVLSLAALGSGGPLVAQNPWAASYYPFFLKTANEKLSFVVHYQYAQLADYDDRVSYTASLSLEGGINADGGRWLIGRFKGPLLLDGWRFFAEAGAVREARFGYFGLGNDTEEIDDPGNPTFNRMRRNRYYARADLARRLVGRLQAAVGGGLVDANFSVLPGDSRFFQDCFPLPPALQGPPFQGTGGDCASDVDAMGRVALILDTRDNEFLPIRGVLLEAGAFAGSGGDGYGGVYGIAQGYFSPREGMLLAARVLGRWLGDGAPLDARYGVPAWERTISVVGGPESHRSFVSGRFAGRDVILANAEVRQDILNFGDYGGFTALGFLDAARVSEWDNEGLADAPQDSGDFHLGGGVGLSLRILRATILTSNWAWGKDGFQFAMGTGWMF
jgi:Omp85 superfamily domain